MVPESLRYMCLRINMRSHGGRIDGGGLDKEIAEQVLAVEIGRGMVPLEAVTMCVQPGRTDRAHRQSSHRRASNPSDWNC